MKPAAQTQLLSVLVSVTPANDLAELHGEMIRVLDELGIPYEILYLVHASSGQVVAQLQAIQTRTPGVVRVLQFGQNLPDAAKLRAGVEKARGEWIVTLSDRYSVDLGVLRSLCDALVAGDDLAFASRSATGLAAAPHWQSRLFNQLVAWASGTQFRDIASATRAFRREVMEQTPLYGDFHRYLPILAERLGFRVSELPARLDPRSPPGRLLAPSLYLWRAMDVLAVMFVSRFTRYPLRLFGGVGSLFAGLGLAILIVVGIQRLLGTSLANRPILVLGTLLIGLGVQSFTLGLLGELILFFRARTIRDYRISAIHESSPPPLASSSPPRSRTAG